MKTPILGSTYVARDPLAANNRLVNLFPEITPDNGNEAAFFNRAPGLRRILTLGTGPIRGMWTYAGKGYIVSGVEVYEIDTNYTYKLIGVVSGTGQVSMADNGIELFIACNGPSYIYNRLTGSFNVITDVDFPGALTVGFIDGYFVFNEPNSQRIWVTGLYNGSAIDPLDFASAEGSPDNIVSVMVDHREVWIFGVNSIEVWYNAGALDFPLQRIQGAFNEIGCLATFSVAKLDNTLFWLGSDARGEGIVYKANGYTGQRVSTHAVEWHIQQYENLSDAVGYTYQQDGHSFYVLNFPSANTTWVYDVATEAWHERAAWEDNQFKRHRSNCQMSFAHEIFVGDYQDGRVYVFDLYDYSDDGQIQKWLRSWRALPSGTNNLTRTAHHSLQLNCATGVGLQGNDPNDPPNQLLITQSGDIITTENGDPIAVSPVLTQGVNPLAMLRWSDDSGLTWSNEHWVSMGRIGRYGTRAIWRRLGMTLERRDRVYEVSGTDPVKIAIVGAELILSPTTA